MIYIGDKQVNDIYYNKQIWSSGYSIQPLYPIITSDQLKFIQSTFTFSAVGGQASIYSIPEYSNKYIADIEYLKNPTIDVTTLNVNTFPYIKSYKDIEISDIPDWITLEKGNLHINNRGTVIGKERSVSLLVNITDYFGNKSSGTISVSQEENKLEKVTHGIDIQFDYPLKDGITLSNIPWDFGSNSEVYKDFDKMESLGGHKDWWASSEVVLAVGNWSYYTSGASEPQDAYSSNWGVLDFPDGKPDWVTSTDNYWNIWLSDNTSTNPRSVKISATYNGVTYVNIITQLGKT